MVKLSLRYPSSFLMVVLLVMILTYASNQANADREIIVEGSYQRDVVGNGSGADGYAPGSPTSGLLDPNNNTLHFSADITGYSVYGSLAYATSGDLGSSGNTLNFMAGAKAGNAYGAEARSTSAGTVTVEGNVLNVRGGYIDHNAYGGYALAASGHAEAKGNEARVHEGEIDYYLSGGYAWGGLGALAEGNTARVGGSVYYDAYGGFAYSTSTTEAAVASANRLFVYDGGVIKGYFNTGEAHNAYGDARSSGNHASVTGGDISQDPAAGKATARAKAVAEGNIFEFSGGRIGAGLYGGIAVSYSDDASANGNKVTVSGGLNEGSLQGGYSQSESSSAGATAEANGNMVEIGGGEIRGNVYGGYIGYYTGSTLTTARATGNTVTISGSPTLSRAGLYGGYIDRYLSGLRDAVTGNTLNIKTAGLEVASIANFEFLNFFLPASLAGGGTVVEVVGSADIAGAKVNVGVEGSASRLREGDEVILIDAAGGLTGPPANTRADGMGLQGVSLRYEFDLAVDGGKLKALVTKAEANPGVKALAEGFAAGLGLLVEGLGRPEAAAAEAASYAAAGGRGVPESARWRVFSSVSGGRGRLNTGSHVDLRSLSASLGLARRFQAGSAGLLAGAFVEFGTGSYETFNPVAGSSPVEGEGDLRYLGGGVLVGIDRIQAGPGQFALALSGRMGSIENEFASPDLRSSSGVAASYRTSTAYRGLGLEAGYRFPIAESASAEVFARWDLTRQDGETARLSTGEDVSFGDADSSRIKAGVRLSRSLGQGVELYAGAGWERELEGAAESSVHGLSIDPPSMRGDSGLGEAGLRYRPSEGGRLSLDFGLQGRFGKREGVSGNLTVKLEF